MSGDSRPVSGHTFSVVVEPGARYPYRPVCSCGEVFWGYASRRAAETVAEAADEHLRNVPACGP